MGFSLKKLVQGAADVVGLDGHVGYQGTYNKPAPPAPASTARPDGGQSFAQKADRFVNKVAGTRLKGVEQLLGRDDSNPITVGDVATHTPVLSDAIEFANKPKDQQGVGDFTKSIFKSGAKNAGYAVPEARIIKAAPEAGVVVKATTKLINNAAPAVPASVIGQVAAGERDPKDIAAKALTDATINGAIPASTELVKPLATAVKTDVKMGMPALKNEGGYIATPSAANYDKYKAKGLPETTFPDKVNGIEISDKGMKIKPEGLAKMTTGEPVGLGDLIDHKNLEKDYPTFFGGGTGGVKVGFDVSDPTLRAFYNPDTNAIHINPNAFGKDADSVVKSLQTDHGRKILTHEISHAIDEYSGAPRGGSPETVAKSLQDPQVVEAQNTLKAYEDGYNQLKANRDAGVITDEQFKSDPHVQAYEAAQAVAAQGEKPNPVDVWRAYNRQPNEQRATMVADRSNMSQREINKNPMGAQAQPFRIEGAGDNIMASMEQPSGVTENALTRKGKQGRQNISPELQGRISGEHAIRNTQELADTAKAQADQSGLDATIQQAHDALAVERGKITDKDVALAHQAIERADAAGRLDDANALHDALSDHLVAQGQSIQAASLLYRRSPQGMLHKAERDLRRAGVDITDEMHAKLQAHVEAIKAAEGAAKDRAKAEMGQTVVSFMPKSTTKNIISVWKAGLLSGLKTQGGNFESNAVFGGLKKTADFPATLADKLISLKTGERTKTATFKGGYSGLKEGYHKGVDTLKTGLDERDFVGATDKYDQYGEINFGDKNVWQRAAQKVFGTPANFVFRGMKAADQPFHYATLKNTLYDMAKADGINKGYKGAELKSYMEKTVQNPPLEMAEKALTEANKGTLAHDTFLASVVPAIKRGIQSVPGAPQQAKDAATAALDVIVPFSRIPAGFISRTIDFTPLGIAREAVEQAWRGNFDQRKLAQAIGEGVTGTGLIVLGMGLSKNGQISGDYPRNDQKEQERWKAEGITPNSVKLGNDWISMNYLGPIGLLFNAGHKIEEAAKNGSGVPGDIASAMAGLGQGLMGQSFLQGFSGVADAINDPARNAGSFIRSQVGSAVPSWLNDIANITDSKQRQANGPWEALAARIPGLRESLNPKQTAFGQDLNQPAGGLNVAANPLKPSPDMNNTLTTELNRLKGTGKENFVFPTPDKTIEVDGETIKLNGDEQYAYNKVKGQQIEQVWNQIIASPDYQALNDTDKASALRGAMSDVNAVAKAQMLDAMGKSDQAKAVADKLSDNQYRIMTGGNIDPADYVVDKTTTPGDSTGSKTARSRNKTPKKDYDAAVAKYERDKDKLSAADRFSREKDLRTMKIKSDYTQEVIDMYGMSKGDLQDFLDANPDKKDLVGQVLELDQKLADAGGKKTKFGGTVASKGKGGGSKKGGKKGKTDYAKGLANTRALEAKTTSALRSIAKSPKIKRKQVTKK